MSPEDQARTRLLAHYDRLRTQAIRRLGRLQEQLAGAADLEIAADIRSRLEDLKSVIADMEQKAARIRTTRDTSKD